MSARRSRIVSGLIALEASAAEVAVLDVRAEGVAAHPRRVDQDGDLGRRGDLARRHQGELVQQVQRVLDEADDAGPSPPSSQAPPTCRSKARATPSVTATWPGPGG